VDGLAIFELAEVEVAELALLRGNQHAGDLGAFERRAYGLGRRGADDYWNSLCVCLLEATDVVDPVQDERIVEVDVVLAFDRDFGDAPSGCAEPALPHSSYVAPGAMSTISQLVVSASRQASGVPVRSGKVP
jgi:hypothetical protein